MDFIEEVAFCVQKYAPQFDICVYSPIIAQAVLESKKGTSNKVKVEVGGKTEWRHNYFGLKWRDGRCAISNDYFEEWTAEQNKDGTYTNIVSRFCKFKSLEECVIGYFQWTAHYGAQGITDPEKYLEQMKKKGYATSIKYVPNLMAVIDKYDLTRFDNKGVDSMSNSSLVSYKKISPNKNTPRNHKIDTITIHCIVGQWTAKQGCDFFSNPERKASCNYVVGKDGSIGLCVDEADRSWCSSSSANDNRAITIEVACDTFHPYKVTDEAYKALVKLCADICKRNGIKELKWKADKSLVGQVDKQNMTVHRWFANKACPGDYLYSLHGQIAKEVNAMLGTVNEQAPAQTAKTLFKVQVGAYSKRENAEAMLAKLKKAGFDGFIATVTK
jgi:hypothetical protein